MCLPDGSPVRAKIRLGLMEIQDEITSVTSRVVDDDGEVFQEPIGQVSGGLRVGPIQ
jgi:hypothetical protein